MKCKACGKVLESGLVICPFCRTDPNTAPEINLSAVQIKSIGKQLRREIIKGVLWWLGVLSLVFGFGLVQVYRIATRRVSDEMTTRITDEFKQPLIRATVESVASNNARVLLIQQVQPDVDRFKKEMMDSTVLTKDLARATQTELAKVSLIIAETSSNLHQRVTSLDTRIETSEMIEKHLQTTLIQAQKALEDLRAQSQFILVVASAQADDRTAYEQLTKWAHDENYPLREQARKIYRTVQADYWGQRGQKNWRFLVWSQKVEPEKFTLAQVKAVWSGIDAECSRAFVSFVWDHTILTKEEKLSFLHDILSDSHNSLLAADAAARLLADEGKVIYDSPFDFAAIEKWWIGRRGTNKETETSANKAPDATR